MVVTASVRTPHVQCDRVYLEGLDGAGFALRGLTLAVDRGALRPLLGPAGAGKTALLRVLAGLVRPAAGTVEVAGVELQAAPDAELRELRRAAVGLVPHAAANLAPRLSAAANVELPLRLAGVSGGRARRRAEAARSLVGLDEPARVRAERLPPLARVRTGLAAALVREPELLLLDEPAAGLTEDEQEELLDLLRRVNDELGVTTLLATRDAGLAYRVGGVLRIREGRVVSELVRRVAFSRGEGERTEELAVVDGDGRVELPAEHRDAFGIERRARLTIEDDHVGVWPERPPPDTSPSWRRR